MTILRRGALTVAGVLLFTACGGGTDTATTTEPAPVATTPTTTAPAPTPTTVAPTTTRPPITAAPTTAAPAPAPTAPPITAAPTTAAPAPAPTTAAPAPAPTAPPTTPAPTTAAPAPAPVDTSPEAQYQLVQQFGGFAAVTQRKWLNDISIPESQIAGEFATWWPRLKAAGIEPYTSDFRGGWTTTPGYADKWRMVTSTAAYCITITSTMESISGTLTMVDTPVIENC